MRLAFPRLWLGWLLAAGVTGVAGGAEAVPISTIQALMEAGKLEEALTLTDAELKRNDADATLRFLRGLVLTRLNRFEQAIDAFSKLTEDHPELPEPYNNLAVVYAATGDYERAREALQKAINTHPSYATAHENMGDIYAKLASQAYNQALELKEDNLSAKAKLALINDLFSLPASDQHKAAPAAADSTPPAGITAQVDPALTAATGTGARIAAGPEPPGIAETMARLEPAVTATAGTGAEIAGPPAVAASVPERPAQEAGIAEVRRTVDLWVIAWSSQDINGYLSYYAPEFVPGDGGTARAWRESRRKRLSEPKFIQVDISDLHVVMHGEGHAQASFIQQYRSDSYNDRVRKTLLLKQSDQRWLIVGESSQ